MLYLTQQILNGLLVSIHYALLAVAYVLVHAVTRQANLLFGSLATWAGYMVINWTLYLLLIMPGAAGPPLLAAVSIALMGTSALGYVIARTVMLPLVRQSTLPILIASLGLAIVLEEVMRIANDGREAWLMPILNKPVIISANPEFPLQLTLIQIIIFISAAVLAVALVLFIRHHPFGRAWRAAADDFAMAGLCGINTTHLVMVTFVIASGFAAISGAFIAVQYGSVSFYGGLIISLKTLFIAIIGGLRSVGGAIAGALLLAMTETLWSAYFSMEYRDAAAFLLLSLLMILFPSGLFGGKREAERI